MSKKDTSVKSSEVKNTNSKRSLWCLQITITLTANALFVFQVCIVKLRSLKVSCKWSFFLQVTPGGSQAPVTGMLFRHLTHQTP